MTIISLTLDLLLLYFYTNANVSVIDKGGMFQSLHYYVVKCNLLFSVQ
jgi:hypothetical protein